MGGLVPKRYVLAMLASLGCAILYSMRTAPSVSIIIMARQYGYSGTEKGQFLSSYYYGYILTQFLGGVAAKRWGSRRVLSLGVFGSGLSCMLTPLAAQHSWSAAFAMRVVAGISEGVVFPCLNELWSKWAPPLEVSRLSGITFAGCYLGSFMSLPIWGALCDGATTSLLGASWHLTFYLSGGLAVLWSALWMCVARSSPVDDPAASAAEKRHLLASRAGRSVSASCNDSGVVLLLPTSDFDWSSGSLDRGFGREEGSENHCLDEGGLEPALTASSPLADASGVPCAPQGMATPSRRCEARATRRGRIPWTDLLTSLPVWAIVVASAANSFSFFMLLSLLPTYLHDVFQFRIQTAGMSSALPYFVLMLTTLAASSAVDSLRKRKVFSTVLLRKAATVVSFSIAATFLLLAGFLPRDDHHGHVCAVLFITLAVAGLGVGSAGWDVNALDIAPEFAGIILALSNSAATLCGIITPYFVQVVARSSDPAALRAQWQTVFCVAAGVHVAGAVFYATCAQARVQDWACVLGHPGLRSGRPLSTAVAGGGCTSDAFLEHYFLGPLTVNDEQEASAA